MTDEHQPEVAHIEIDRELCIGAATCVALMPNVFKLDEEGKAVVQPGVTGGNEALIAAAKSCPVKAIRLLARDGKPIYPEPAPELPNIW